MHTLCPPSCTQTTARQWILRCFSWELILPPFSYSTCCFHYLRSLFLHAAGHMTLHARQNVMYETSCICFISLCGEMRESDKKPVVQCLRLKATVWQLNVYTNIHDSHFPHPTESKPRYIEYIRYIGQPYCNVYIHAHHCSVVSSPWLTKFSPGGLFTLHPCLGSFLSLDSLAMLYLALG